MKTNKRALPIFFFLLFLVLNFSCKKKITNFIEVTNSDLVINMTCDGGYWERCYTGFAVRFSPNTGDFPETDPDVIYEWDLGDGSTSSEILPYHEYESIGTYTIKVKATFEEFQYLAERTIEIEIPPTIIEEESQQGIFLHQTTDGIYSFLYIDPNIDKYVTRYQEGNILSKKKLFQHYTINSEIAPIQKANGNIVFVEGNDLIEIKPDGEIISEKYLYANPTSFFKSLSGYSSTNKLGDDASLSKYDNEGNQLEYNNIFPFVENYIVEGVTQAAADSFFVTHIGNGNQVVEQNSILQRIDFEGNEVWKKEYDFQIGSRIDLLSDGYLAHYSFFIGSSKSHFLTKLDFQGNVIWRKEISENYNYIRYSIFEEGDDLIIFFDNMRGIRISGSGLSTVWDKTFGFGPSVFKHAIRNVNGNFTLMGTRYQYPSSEDVKPSIMVEVNSDGKIIEW